MTAARIRADALWMFLFALAVRVLFCFAVYPQVAHHFGPGDGYDDIARSLAAGRGYTLAGVPAAAERLPLYPVALAVSFALFGPAAWPWQLAQTLCGAATCALVLMMAGQYASRPGAWAAATVCALHPTLLLYTARPLTETLYIFLLLLFVWCVSAPMWQPRVVGFLLALELLIKSTALVHVLAFAPAARRGRFAALARTAAVALVILLPWVARNVWSDGHAHLLTATSGRGLYHGLYISRHVSWTTPAGDFNRDAELALWEDLARHGVAPDADVQQRDAIAGQAARQWIASHPKEALGLWARNLLLTWYLGRSHLSLVAHGLLHGSLLIAAGFGAVRLWYRRPDARDLVSIAVLLVLAYTGLHAVVQPAVRYILPVVPLVALLAAGVTAQRAPGE